MRGEEEQQLRLITYLDLQQAIPKDHPLRPIREIVNKALEELSPVFDEIYADRGRTSIPPERLLRALFLQILYSIRSERMLVEQLRYNLLFRWFVGLQMDEEVWNHSTFSKNRKRLMDGQVADLVFDKILEHARINRLLSSEHFTVDGTLIEAWASLKSLQERGDDDDPPPSPSSKKSKKSRKKGRNKKVDFKGKKRSNKTHVSRTDPEARLFTKGSGQAAKLSYMGHALTENQNGLVIDARVTQATGYAEREAAIAMLEKARRNGRATVGADKAYDTRDFVADLRDLEVTPHLAQNTSNRTSAIDRRTTRHTGYATSQRRRKMVEEVFGWIKTVGGLRKVKHRGRRLVDWTFKLAAAAYNLVRIRSLTWAPA